MGHPPDPRAIAEAARHGIDITAYRGRQVQSHDFKRFTHIFALDAQNYADLSMLRPAAATAQLSLLLDHVSGMAGQPVADPYWGDAAAFAATWRQVDDAARALVALFNR